PYKWHTIRHYQGGRVQNLSKARVSLGFRNTVHSCDSDVPSLLTALDPRFHFHNHVMDLNAVHSNTKHIVARLGWFGLGGGCANHMRPPFAHRLVFRSESCFLS